MHPRDHFGFLKDAYVHRSGVEHGLKVPLHNGMGGCFKASRSQDEGEKQGLEGRFFPQANSEAPPQTESSGRQEPAFEADDGQLCGRCSRSDLSTGLLTPG